MTSDDLIHEALIAAAEDYPSSIIADLLTQFSMEDVVKFIVYFNGQVIRVPSVDKIWRGYRNRVIQTTLDSEDSATTRNRLAKYFGISIPYLALIYHKSKQKKRGLSKSVVNLSASRIYNTEMAKLLKEVQTTLLKKH